MLSNIAEETEKSLSTRKVPGSTTRKKSIEKNKQKWNKYHKTSVILKKFLRICKALSMAALRTSMYRVSRYSLLNKIPFLEEISAYFNNLQSMGEYVCYHFIWDIGEENGGQISVFEPWLQSRFKSFFGNCTSVISLTPL